VCGVTRLVVVVPTRGRPESIGRLIEAWRVTGAFEQGARMVLAVDRDDPRWYGYDGEVRAPGVDPAVSMVTLSRWQPMVGKLDQVALDVVRQRDVFAVGFAGDDHVPRTHGWVAAYLEALTRLGTGIVHGDDGFHGVNLPTEWAMTADIVRTLERMVPAPVDHLYCDNAVQDLGRGADCLEYLPGVVIEHMNPYAGGKAPMDDQYRRVNSKAQFAADGEKYRRWRRDVLPVQVAAVRALRAGTAPVE
jgi:hypothetical protein